MTEREPSTTPQTLHKAVVIQNSMDELDRVRTLVTDAASQYFDRIETNRIALAVDEALANILEHAYPPDSQETIDLELDCDGSSFTVILMDRAKPFDPTQLPPLDLEAAAASGHDGGMGVFLFTTLMDVSYHSRQGGGNILTMYKKIA